MRAAWKIPRTAFITLVILFAAASVVTVLFDGQRVVGRLTKDGPTLDRTFKLGGQGYPSQNISWQIPREAVEQTVQNFGLERAELEQELGREAERFAARHNIKINLTVKNEMSYGYQFSYRGNVDGRRLESDLDKALEAAATRYYTAHYVRRKDAHTLQVDYPALQLWQAPIIRPLYDRLLAEARSATLNDREFLTLLSGFVQQMPYKIPPDRQNGRTIFGVWPPVVSLKEQAGDCDTKSTLFATLYYHYRKKGCILIETPQHSFIGVSDQHRVFPRDRIARIGGREYLLVETTRPWEMGKIPPDQLNLVRSGRFSYLAFH